MLVDTERSSRVRDAPVVRQATEGRSGRYEVLCHRDGMLAAKLVSLLQPRVARQCLNERHGGCMV